MNTYYTKPMIKSERIAKKISKNIQLWKKDPAKLVVAIDGYAGSGKSTIADFIANQDSDICVIHLDDFIKHWKDRKMMINEVADKPGLFQNDWYRYPDLEKVICAFRNGKKGYMDFKAYDFDANDFGKKKTLDLSKKILIIEGVFLFNPEHNISSMWDKRIYLKSDFVRADKRRILREKTKWGKAYIPESHPDNWTRYFKVAYRRYVNEIDLRKIVDISFTV